MMIGMISISTVLLISVIFKHSFTIPQKI